MKLDTIAKLWLYGRSQREIGLALGMTRGAVAGKISRARLRGDQRFLKPRPAKPPPPAPPKPLPPRILVELRLNDCRWPVGQTPEDLHLFCGHPQKPGSPYCAKHWAIASRGI
jgi:GcrA cell cycle regulator